MTQGSISGPVGTNPNQGVGKTPGPMGLQDSADINQRYREPSLNTPGPLGSKDGVDVNKKPSINEWMQVWAPKGMPKAYQNPAVTKFQFVMYENGYIYVDENDWISKYTNVLFADPENPRHWKEFVRWDRVTANLAPIKDHGAIKTGEVLFYLPLLSKKMGAHIPARIKRQKFAEAVDNEVARIVKKKAAITISENVKLRPNDGETVIEVVDAIGHIGTAARTGGTLAAVAGFGGAATALAVTGALLMIPGAIAACFKAAELWEFEEKSTGMIGAAYAMTAFGYKKAMPTPPDFNFQWEQQYGGPSNKTRKEAAESRRAWEKGAEDALKSLRSTISDMASGCMQSRDSQAILISAGIRRERKSLSPSDMKSLNADLITFFTSVARQLIQIQGMKSPRKSLLLIYGEMSSLIRSAKWSHSPSVRQSFVLARNHLSWPCPNVWMRG